MSLVENIELPETVEVVSAGKGRIDGVVRGKDVKVVVEDPRYITVSGRVSSPDVVKVLDKLIDEGRIENYYFEGGRLFVEIWVPEEPVCEDDWVYYYKYLEQAMETLKFLFENVFKN